MPKFNYKIDYRALTAAHYTTYDLTPQAKAQIAKNDRRFIDIAENAMATTKRRALTEARASLFGNKIDTYT